MIRLAACICFVKPTLTSWSGFESSCRGWVDCLGWVERFVATKESTALTKSGLGLCCGWHSASLPAQLSVKFSFVVSFRFWGTGCCSTSATPVIQTCFSFENRRPSLISRLLSVFWGLLRSSTFQTLSCFVGGAMKFNPEHVALKSAGLRLE